VSLNLDLDPGTKDLFRGVRVGNYGDGTILCVLRREIEVAPKGRNNTWPDSSLRVWNFTPTSQDLIFSKEITQSNAGTFFFFGWGGVGVRGGGNSYSLE
jgi:hypothetical protein